MALDIDNLEPVADVDNMDLVGMDRGNTIESPPADTSVQEAKEKQAEEDVKEVIEVKKDEAGEKKDDADEPPRDEKGRFAEKGVTIPKSRFDEAVNKERDAREAAERRLSALERQLAESTQRVEQGQQLAELETKGEELSTQHAQFLVDGEVEKAAEVMKQIRHLDRQIAKVELTTETQRATVATLESEKVDLAIAQLEAEHTTLNPDSDDFDPALANFVLSEQRRLVSEQGMTPSKALIKAGSDIMKRFAPQKQGEPEPEKEGLKNESDRKQAQVSKNLDVTKRQPASMKDVGLDSDKLGATSTTPDVNQMTREEFDALPESTKARMRGDFV